MIPPPAKTKVQMPADPALLPAHVVGVRPDVDGMWVARGEYVLSVETPKGARNVVAPADGVIELHVGLLQDVDGGDLLFAVDRTVAAETFEEAAYAGSGHTDDGVYDEPVPAATPVPERPRRTILQMLFTVGLVGNRLSQSGGSIFSNFIFWNRVVLFHFSS